MHSLRTMGSTSLAPLGNTLGLAAIRVDDGDESWRSAPLSPSALWGMVFYLLKLHYYKHEYCCGIRGTNKLNTGVVQSTI
jgi:hypothetical protein